MFSPFVLSRCWPKESWESDKWSDLRINSLEKCSNASYNCSNYWTSWVVSGPKYSLRRMMVVIKQYERKKHECICFGGREKRRGRIVDGVTWNDTFTHFSLPWMILYHSVCVKRDLKQMNRTQQEDEKGEEVFSSSLHKQCSSSSLNLSLHVRIKRNQYPGLTLPPSTFYLITKHPDRLLIPTKSSW